MIVVDTNVVIYLVVNGEYTKLAEDVRRCDRSWVAPMLWRSEFLNVLMGYIRCGSLSLSNAISLAETAELKIESRFVDSSRVIELAAGSGCTAYDCEFISLAERLSIPLVTTDKQLLAAFPDIAVSMQTFAAA